MNELHWPQILTAEQVAQVGALIESAFPEFYDLFKMSKDLKNKILGEQTHIESECSRWIVACSEARVGRVAGIICHYPCEEASFLRTCTVKTWLEHCENQDGALTGLQQLQKLAAIPADGIYISRVAVAPELQGRHVFSKMLQRLEAGLPAACPIYLHVKNDNLPAILAYRKVGFSAHKEGHYLLMKKSGVGCVSTSVSP